MVRYLVALCAGVTTLIWVWSAAAEEALSCGAFTLEQHGAEVHFIGEESTRVVPGDRRVLRWELLHPSESKAGIFNVVTTVLGPTEGGDAVLATGALVFKNGSLFVEGQGVLADPSDTTKSNATEVQWAITGGVGTFANATGVITATPPSVGEIALDHWTLEVAANCHD